LRFSFFFSFFISFSLFRVSKWTVSTIDVFCLLSIFYLFFDAQSPMEVSVSRLHRSLTMQYNRYEQTAIRCHIWPFFFFIVKRAIELII
jgi:hypothetical protein